MDNLWSLDEFPKLWESGEENNLYDPEDFFSENYLENNVLEENFLI
ncbi:hypothetical protein KEJ50_06215 [Candidatus Bathyarchaeota archaeon]|nr:hypothetical protein [Candidatus Bathyarchaeota archaeon]